jgi:hypothetical protein
MGLQVLVSLKSINDLDKSFKETLIITVVESLEILPQEGDVSNDS